MAEVKRKGTRLFLVPALIAVPAVALFMFLLYPSVKAALSAGNAAESLAIHQRDVTNLLVRKSMLLSECDTAQVQTDRLKKLQEEEQIKLERAQAALKTAGDQRQATIAEQMRFETIQRDLMSTNNALRIESDAILHAKAQAARELASLQTNCTQRQAEVDASTVERKTAEEQLGTLRTEIESLKAQRAQYMKSVESLKQEASQNEESARKTLTALRKAETTLANAETDAGTAVKRRDSLIDSVAQHMKTLAALTNQTVSARQEAVTEAASFKALKEQVDQLRTDVVTYTAQLTQLKGDVKAESDRKASQSSTIKASEQEVKLQTARLKELQDQIAEEGSTLKSVRSTVDGARADYVSYSALVEQLKKESLRVRSELSQLKGENKQQ